VGGRGQQQMTNFPVGEPPVVNFRERDLNRDVDLYFENNPQPPCRGQACQRKKKIRDARSCERGPVKKEIATNIGPIRRDEAYPSRGNPPRNVDVFQQQNGAACLQHPNGNRAVGLPPGQDWDVRDFRNYPPPPPHIMMALMNGANPEEYKFNTILFMIFIFFLNFFKRIFEDARRMMINPFFLMDMLEANRQRNEKKKIKGFQKEEINEMFREISFRQDYSRQPSGEEVQSCVICLADLNPGEKVRYLPCQHKFHSQCIDVWLEKRPNCPTCKKDLR
jgi:hypothetical protein